MNEMYKLVKVTRWIFGSALWCCLCRNGETEYTVLGCLSNAEK